MNDKLEIVVEGGIFCLGNCVKTRQFCLYFFFVLLYLYFIQLPTTLKVRNVNNKGETFYFVHM